MSGDVKSIGNVSIENFQQKYQNFKWHDSMWVHVMRNRYELALWLASYESSLLQRFFFSSKNVIFSVHSWRNRTQNEKKSLNIKKPTIIFYAIYQYIIFEPMQLSPNSLKNLTIWQFVINVTNDSRCRLGVIAQEGASIHLINWHTHFTNRNACTYIESCTGLIILPED